MNKITKVFVYIYKMLKNIVGDKFNICKVAKPVRSNIYKSMLITNGSWEERLNRDGANFRKTDNAMSMIYYLLFSMVVFHISDKFVVGEMSNYYIYMIDWIILLTFSVSLQLLMKFMRKMTWRTMLIQSAQIFIITLFSMIVAFSLDLIFDNFQVSEVVKYIIITAKSLLIFVITMLIFGGIEKSYSKLLAAAEQKLWHIAINENNSISSDILVSSISKTLSNIVGEIAVLSTIKREIISDILLELQDDKNALDTILKTVKGLKPETIKHIKQLAYYRQAFAGYLDGYMNGDNYKDISLDNVA